MTVLVTGATGFIGRHLTPRLLSEGESVRVITRDPSRLPPEWAHQVEVVVGSLLDPAVLEVAVRGISTIFHLAGEIQDKALMTAVNAEAVHRLLDSAEAAGVRRFVHLSSVGVVGADGPGIVTEDTQCKPQNEYEQSKLAGERAVLERGAAGRIEAVILRPTIVFGELQNRSRDSLLGWLRALQRGRFFFIGDEAVANYVYVGDVIEAAWRLYRADTPGAVIVNLADPAPMSDFVGAMARALGISTPRKRIPFWLAYPFGAVFELASRLVGVPLPLTRSRVRALSSKCLYSGERLRQMGITLPFGYEIGLERTVQWYRQAKTL
jgi:nucleoside-diphosphate-sugar epimerase